jgi:hypothetical protein
MEKEFLVPIGQKAEWPLELAWTLWSRKILDPARN